MIQGDAQRGSVRRRVLRHRWRWWLVGTPVALVLGVGLAFALSPRPGAFVVRSFFERDAARVKAALAKHAPQGISSIVDQPYRAGDGDAYLDVYFPTAAAQPGVRLPTLVWTHGGGWVSGHKDDTVPYFQLIAATGFAVVSLGYSPAPGKQYPTPVVQVNDALAYLRANADRLHVDPERVMLGGGSAGAQIASQVATLVTSPAYAAELGIAAALKPEHLRGVVLYSGYYDLNRFVEDGNATPVRLLRWGVTTVVWAYVGSKRPDDATLRQMSAIAHATAAFPPTFISGGNGDPLTDAHARPFAARLEGLGVAVTALFYPADHDPRLGHEYQYNLDIPDGQNALAQMLAFMKQRTGG